MENKFSNKQIAKLLKNIADAYLLLGENKFKIIAYQKAADTIENLSREIKDIWQENRLSEVSNIGKSLRQYLDEYFKKGYSKHFNDILNKIPETVFELTNLSGIGPKKAYKLVKALDFNNKETVLEDLKKACKQNKIAQIEGFGQKSQQEIQKAIELYHQRLKKAQRMSLNYAFSLAQEVKNYLEKHSLVKRVDILGSLRRLEVTVGDIDIAVLTKSSKSNLKKYKEIIKYFVRFPKTISIENAGWRKASIIVKPYIKVDIRIEEENSYGSMLQYFTGNKGHNIKLREYALKKGFSLSEYGIKNINNHKLYQFNNEENFYKFLGLQYIPPELRQGGDEIDFALKKKIPKLINLKDIQGDLHLHSSFDIQPSHDLGADDFDILYQKAKKLGYQYLGFTDHNPKKSLNEDEIFNILKSRYYYIVKKILSIKFERLNYFIGIEADILPDGSIPIQKKALDFLDYIIVSIHSVFDLDIKTMTKRVLKALSFPKVKILGHPTGRLIGHREGFELEWEKVFEICKKNNIALEINSSPLRLDLPDILVKQAIQNGVKLIINTDAHKVDQMNLMFYGVAVARRGWAKKNDIINTMPYKDFRKWLLNL